MTVVFNKYEGAGNDFVIIDNRNGSFISDEATIARLCNRRFGIGADGLILICREPGLPYRMRYFNADGREGSMCGNGGRCSAHFAVRHNIAGSSHQFMAIDGIHSASVGNTDATISMSDVSGIDSSDNKCFLNTGSPHLVVFVPDADTTDVFNAGRELRYSPLYAPGGTNVNFVSVDETGLFVRTYERGVEDETLSCGTGVTASAIASVFNGHFGSSSVIVRTRGGVLKVNFTLTDTRATGVTLTGPATFVFSGDINI